MPYVGGAHGSPKFLGCFKRCFSNCVHGFFLTVFSYLLIKIINAFDC